MPYAHISRQPGRSLADYRTVVEAMGGDPPEGRLFSTAGEADGALHVVDVWQSRASADRFAAERLLPAFQQTGLRPGPDSTYVAFETDNVALSGDGR